MTVGDSYCTLLIDILVIDWLLMVYLSLCIPGFPDALTAMVLATRARCAHGVIMTDFIQLLKLHSPIIHDTPLIDANMSGCALSGQLAKLGQSFRQGGRQHTVIHDKPSVVGFFGDGCIIRWFV